MTLRTWTYEDGSNGAAITGPLSGTGASNPVVDSGGSATFIDVTPYQGHMAGRYAYTAGTTGVLQHHAMAATNTVFAFTFAFRLVSDLIGGTIAVIGQGRNSTGAPFSIRAVAVSGVVSLHLFVGTVDLGQIGTGTIADDGSTWYRVSGEVNGTTGAYAVRLRDAADALIGTTKTGTDAGMVATYVGVRVGIIGSLAQAATVDIDWISVNDGGTSELSAPVNEPPTVEAGANQSVTAGATVNLSGAASDADGSIASVAWSHVAAASTSTPTLTGGTTLTPSFTAGSAPSLHTVQLTGTDDLGSTASDTVEVRVPVAGNVATRPLPFAATKVGTWTRTGGSTEGGVLADDDNATYLESGSVSGTEQSIRARLAPSAARATGKIEVTLSMDTGTGTWQIRLYEGSTLRQSWSQPGVPSTPTAYELTLAAGTIAAITDWGNLRLELGVTS